MIPLSAETGRMIRIAVACAFSPGHARQKGEHGNDEHSPAPAEQPVRQPRYDARANEHAFFRYLPFFFPDTA